jgi:hypothetical protein
VCLWLEYHWCCTSEKRAQNYGSGPILNVEAFDIYAICWTGHFDITCMYWCAEQRNICISIFVVRPRDQALQTNKMAAVITNYSKCEVLTTNRALPQE